MIRAFPAAATVDPGDDLVLHVSTDAPRFAVDLYRFGATMTPVGTSGWREGRWAPCHLPYQDWRADDVGPAGEPLAGWPEYRFAIPADAASGVYVAVLVEGDGHGNRVGVPSAAGPTPDGRHAKALFVVRAPTAQPRASILYKLPLLTYHAYNCGAERGGWSLYTVPEADPVPPSVSLCRPGGGTGGTPSDMHNVDPFDATPRQTFVHWDAPFVRWLERNGYHVDYCTDVDLHEDVDDALLRGYRLLVSAGHDEYWTDAMRDNAERFVAGGGNVAFFGGNTCWWRVSFDDACTFRRVAEWWDPAGPARPENALTGVSFRNGGERDRDDHPVPVGYNVQHADHWVYDGTGLHDGETFGDGPGEYLVGYECDGARFDRAALDRGGPVMPTADDGTPESFVILGVGDAARSGWGMGNGAATMGLYSNGGTVFNAATTDWARLLGAPGGTTRGDPHPVVARITANVIDRLGG